MRILHIPHAYHPVVGGTELLCKRVGEVLAAQGHDVRVLTTDVGAVQAYYEFGIDRVACSEEIISGVPVRRLRFCDGFYRAGGWIGGYMPRPLAPRIASRIRQLLYKRLNWQITREIARFRPDVVMTMPHLLANVEATLAARSRLGFPLVLVPLLHETDANWNIPMMTTALAAADAVIAQTAYEVDRLAEAYNVAREKIFFSSEGIDPVPDVTPLPPASKRVVFLGRQVKSKGIDDLI